MLFRSANAWELSALDSINQLQYYKPAQWEVCSPQTVRAFSAVAYYLGRRLQKELNMPIGLICNAVGGSPTEAWVDRRTLEYEFPRILNNWRENDFIILSTIKIISFRFLNYYYFIKKR